MKRLTPALKRGDLDACKRGVSEQLRKLPRSPFHIVEKLAISNDPADAARHFDRFLQREAKRIDVAAAYTEMNGFDINPDRWYCDLFAYTSDGGTKDFDWLSDWQSKPFDEYEIHGLEELQDVYASDLFGKKEFDDASYLSSLMVVVKFQQFMKKAASHMMELSHPLYISAHEFTFIAAVRPQS
jgi:hypothetical protein